MKGKTKEQKGITLIALIITIVVLMILAAVAISSIQNDGGILGFAQSAADQYKDAQQSEKDILGGYEIFLQGKSWTQNGTTVTRGEQIAADGVTKIPAITLKVGQKVNFTSEISAYDQKVATNTERYAWRVLGVENGQLLLISGAGVGYAKDANGNYTGGYENGESAYTISTVNDEGKTFLEQLKELDKICAVFEKSEQVVSARCVKAEDLNKITGYNPNSYKDDDLEKHGLSDYGRKVTYKFNANNEVQYTFTDDNGVVRTSTESSSAGTPITRFCKIGQNVNAPELSTESGFTVTCSSYGYKMNDLIDIDSDADLKIMLQSGYHGASTGCYWLNNSAARTRQGAVLYSVLTVRNNYQIGGVGMWQTEKETNNKSESNVIRAVVYLDPSLTVATNGDLIKIK